MKKLRRSFWLAPVALAVTLIVAACGGGDPTAAPDTPQPGSVSVIHQWVSGGDPDSFQAVVQPWEALTGGPVDDLGTRDIMVIVTTKSRQ